MTSILVVDKNAEKIEEYIFSIKLPEDCIQNYLFLDIDKKKIFSMPNDYSLTKKQLDENNVTEWDKYDYIIKPQEVNLDNWNKNKKGILYDVSKKKNPPRIGPPDKCQGLPSDYQDKGAFSFRQDCGIFKSNGGCSSRPADAKEGCAITCGLCSVPDPSTKVHMGGQGGTKKQTGPSFVDQTCAKFPSYTEQGYPFKEQGVPLPTGQHVSCAAAKNQNLCKNPYQWYNMLQYCPITCGWCKPYMPYSTDKACCATNNPKTKTNPYGFNCNCNGYHGPECGNANSDCLHNGLQGHCTNCNKLGTGTCRCQPA